MEQPHVNERKPRLNPFFFPSDTDFRFIMLILVTVTATLLMYSFLYSVFPTNVQALVRVVRSCYTTTITAHPESTFGGLQAFYASYELCVIPSYQVVAVWDGLGVAFLLSVAGAIYWLFPFWKIWRGDFKPLQKGNTPSGLMELLSDLCHQSRLPRSPVFLLNPYSSACSGVAFGRFGRRYIVLHRGMLMLFQRDRPEFRAIVLHELAHLGNADIDKTYFTISIVWSFILTVLLPWIVSLFLVHWTADLIFTIGWSMLALSVLIYFIRNALLRTREVYADVRASMWDGPLSALDRVLQNTRRPKESRWRHWLRTHPDPEKRRRILEDTTSLFRQSFWDALAAGIIVSIILSNVALYIVLFISLNTGVPFFTTNLGSIANGMIAGPLVAGIVGLGMWRAVFAKVARSEGTPGILSVTLGLTLGLLLGQPVASGTLNGGFGFFLGPQDSSGMTPTLQALSLPTQALQVSSLPFLTQFLLVLLASMLLLILMFFFLRWTTLDATLWLAIASRTSSPRRFYWLWLVIASGVAGILLGELSFYSQTFLDTLADPVLLQSIQTGLMVPTSNPVILALDFVVNALTVDPFITLLFVCLWAYPLSSWFWRRRMMRVGSASWAFLDTPAQPQRRTPVFQEPFRLRLALIMGLAGGLVYCAIILLFEYGLKIDVSISDSMLLAVLLQGGIASIIAGTVRRLPVLHGLFGAFVAGCIMSIGLTAIVLFNQSQITLAVIWKVIVRLLVVDGVFMTIINGGAFLALLFGLVVAALASLVRRWQSDQHEKYKPAM
jgi:Zn-dependent protease with chaperone function